MNLYYYNFTDDIFFPINSDKYVVEAILKSPYADAGLLFTSYFTSAN